ncbi:anthranilate synthase component I family protein [Nesterenkonia haasae]|uniref:anthranilate synthase component I family protein n=1 Tax=Nesterenkonia haasae TaxID=2587813 RepID=UPI001390A504|nr:anthranilate synthase component I family protein [Nesterenkonia haasae]NDK31964.1 anthranilate synthase component I family protein [Nesterenkonia haasae]
MHTLNDHAAEQSHRLYRKVFDVGCQEDLAIEVFAQLARAHPQAPACLMDSSDHARTLRPERSKYSILAFSLGEHSAEVHHWAGATRQITPTSCSLQKMPFFEWLRRNWAITEPNLSQPNSPSDVSRPVLGQWHPNTAPFALGWVGWLGYELKRERGSPDGAASQPDPLCPPYDAQLFRVTHALVLDHRTGTAELQSWGRDRQWEERVTEAFAAAESSVQNAFPDVDNSADRSTGIFNASADAHLHLRDTKKDYLDKILAAQTHIAEGNSYEICLTTSVSGPLLGEADGIEVFRRIRRENRTPFTQYLRFDGVEILSTSPERFLSIDASGTARSEPIKGTRPRSTNPEVDEALLQDLRTHPKDRAENVMITDLVRNDLSVHAVPGTLRTERLCAVETYPTVHQLVSTVSARTTAGTHPADVVAAAFPPGSMTGAPKISTMNILEELETGRRGPYSGVAGYFSSSGAMDLSVLIRTVVLTRREEDDGTVYRDFHLGVGGAITADSIPENEWEEVRTKSLGILNALGTQFPESA